jgi:hypothetical protein
MRLSSIKAQQAEIMAGLLGSFDPSLPESRAQFRDVVQRRNHDKERSVGNGQKRQSAWW